MELYLKYYPTNDEVHEIFVGEDGVTVPYYTVPWLLIMYKRKQVGVKILQHRN